MNSNTQTTDNQILKMGDHFRLIGNTTVFEVVGLPLAGGFIPAVHGYTLDGKKETRARIVDVYKVASKMTAAEFLA